MNTRTFMLFNATTNNRLLRTWGVLLCLCSTSVVALIPDRDKKNGPGGIFGILIQEPDGHEVLEVTDVIPLVEGQVFGWIVDLGPGVSRVKWKEVYEVPAQPLTWDIGASKGRPRISEDRMVSILEKEEVVMDGYIQNYWVVAFGDPIGKHVIRVYVDDALVETFHFTVTNRDSAFVY